MVVLVHMDTWFLYEISSISTLFTYSLNVLIMVTESATLSVSHTLCEGKELHCDITSYTRCVFNPK